MAHKRVPKLSQLRKPLFPVEPAIHIDLPVLQQLVQLVASRKPPLHMQNQCFQSEHVSCPNCLLWLCCH